MCEVSASTADQDEALGQHLLKLYTFQLVQFAILGKWLARYDLMDYGACSYYLGGSRGKATYIYVRLIFAISVAPKHEDSLLCADQTFVPGSNFSTCVYPPISMQTIRA